MIRRLGRAAFVAWTALFAIVLLLWMESYQKDWGGEVNWSWFGVTDHLSLNAEPGRMTVGIRNEEITEEQHRYRFDTYDIDQDRVSPSDWAYNSRDTVRRAQFGDFRYYLMVPRYGGPVVTVRAVDIPAWFLALVTGLAALGSYRVMRGKIIGATPDPAKAETR